MQTGMSVNLGDGRTRPPRILSKVGYGIGNEVRWMAEGLSGMTRPATPRFSTRFTLLQTGPKPEFISREWVKQCSTGLMGVLKLRKRGSGKPPEAKILQGDQQ